ncbi:hypothetical protein [Spirosoma sp. KNUC1025]|uniref:hypothetical protein n=1 Tax=Spirosoma sp. KNUC1025 TaxID=2894082 RepID=UPI0038708D9D|nr:hypothetical protein LN737_32975 [Spirosoma sp. KNUC1025]
MQKGDNGLRAVAPHRLDTFGLLVDESLNRYMKSEAVGSTYSVYLLFQSGRLSNELSIVRGHLEWMGQ